MSTGGGWEQKNLVLVIPSTAWEGLSPDGKFEHVVLATIFWILLP